MEKNIYKLINKIGIVTVAQLVEHWSYEPEVEGSIPSSNI